MKANAPNHQTSSTQAGLGNVLAETQAFYMGHLGKGHARWQLPFTGDKPGSKPKEVRQIAVVAASMS